MRYDDNNVAKIVPHTTGYFKIYMSDFFGPILGSPFFILINPLPEKNLTDSEASENLEKSVPECVESSGIRDTVRNEEASFIIRHKNLELDVIIRNPENEVITIKKKRTVKGFLQVFYTPENIGNYHLYKHIEERYMMVFF